MKDLLVKIYLDGFEQDGRDYAEYFCKKYASCALVCPTDNPISSGYVIPKKLSNGKLCAYFSAIATKKSFRNKGYASCLIKEMLKKAYVCGYPFAVLSPFNSNFYKKFGFFTTQYYEKTLVDGSSIYDVTPVEKNNVDEINSIFSPSAIRLAFDNDYFENLSLETAIYNAKPVKVTQNGKILAFCVKENGSLSRVLENGADICKVANFNGFTLKSPSNRGDAFIQLRILNFQSFVEFLTPCAKCDFKLKLNDCIICENNAVWAIKSDGACLTAKKTSLQNYDFETNVTDLIGFLEEKKLIKPLLTQFIDEY